MDSTENTDMEVAHVLASGFAMSGDHTIPSSRTGSGRSQTSSCDILSPNQRSSMATTPMRPSTAMTNLTRGNRSAATPKMRPLGMYHLAAQGEIVALKSVLNKQAVDEPDENGFTALMWAACYDQLDTVKFLLDQGASCDKKGPKRESVLALSASAGNTDIVNLIISKQLCDINEHDDNCNTALMYACYGAHSKCVQLLLDRGADITLRNADQLSAFDIAVKAKNNLVQNVLEKHLMNLFNG